MAQALKWSGWPTLSSERVGAFPWSRHLDRIFCFVHERIVSHDNVVQWDGRTLQIPPQPRRFSYAGARVQLIESLSGVLSIYHGQTKLRVQAICTWGVTFSLGYNTPGTEACDAVGGAFRPQWREWPREGLLGESRASGYLQHLHYFRVARHTGVMR